MFYKNIEIARLGLKQLKRSSEHANHRHRLPGPDSILKFIRCNCKTGTNEACGKRCYCRKNGLFRVMACGQCHGEECSSKSKSSIIDDIDEGNDCNVLDAFASFW